MKVKIGESALLSIGVFAIGMVHSILTNKQNEMKMNTLVEKKVAEALAKQSQEA